MVTTMESNSVDNSEENKSIKINPYILDSFSKFTADNENVRQKGAIGVLRNLSHAENIDVNSKNHRYSLKRLIRGLGSSQMTSKKGFYISFTAYLTLHSDANIDNLLQIVETELKPSNSFSKSENADIYMGRILFCGSLMRSKLLMDSNAETQSRIIEILLSAGTQRSYLSYVSISFLVDFIDNLDEKSMKVNVWPILSKELTKTWTEHSLDTFYALLFIDNKFPTLIDKKFIKSTLGTETIFDKETIPVMLKLITDLPRIVSYKHPIHKLICEKLASTDYLLDFWMGIDQRFVKTSITIEYLGLELLNHILPNIKDKHLLPSLLSSNFLSHMLKRFNTSKLFHKDDIANLFRSVLTKYVEALNDEAIETKVQVEVIKKLIYYPGDLMVERITGIKILQMIIKNMNATGVKKVAKIFSAIVENTKLRKIENEERSWSNGERAYACQMLIKLLDHSAMTAEYNWKLNQLIFLFKLGFCEIDGIDSNLAVTFEGCLYNALDHKRMKLEDLKKILNELISHLNDMLFINKSETLRKPLNKSSTEAWEKMISFISKTDHNNKNKEIVIIFQITALIMGLFIFSDPEMAISVINEVHSCFERFNNKKSLKGTKKQKEPKWVDVIIDLFLSLLSKNSHLLRSLIQCVFPHICSMLTATAIHHILEVLDPSNEQDLLISEDQQNDNLSNSESDSDDEDHKNKVNKKTKSKKHENEDNTEDEEDEDENEDADDDDDEDDDDDDDEMSEDNEDETLNEKLRIAVSQALGDTAFQNEEEDIDIDEIDEEEGKRLDESLAAAFRMLRDNRPSNRRKQSKTAETLMNFRTRVIDLLEIYLDSGPSMALALDMLTPLFASLEFCIKDHHQKPLESRIRSCIKKLSSMKKFKDTDGVDEKLLTDLFKLLIEKGEKSTSVCHEMADKVAECCTFLIRCAQHVNVPSETFSNSLAKHLTAFFKERDCIISVSLFKSILQLNWEGNWKFILSLIDYAFDRSIRPFRRGQAIDLLITFYRNSILVKNEEYTDLRNKIEKKLCLNCIQLLEESVRQNVPNGESNENQNNETTKETKHKFVYLLWTLLNIIYPIHLPKAWDWEKMANAMTEFRKCNTLSRDAKKPFNKLAKNIGANVQVQPRVKQEKKRKFLVNGVCTNNEDECLEESIDSANNKINNKKVNRKENNELIKVENQSKTKNKKKLKTSDPKVEEKTVLNDLKTVNSNSVECNNSTFISDHCNKKNKSKKRTVTESLDEPQKSKKKKSFKQPNRQTIH
ncbi:myb-binding protein 1A [Chelonus insularis]|uniref:myb-binding protein 1A n=1 Tax=Chelonus insularis TaxID=460826 RepID=UPI00158F55FE|nr:myb-binding protein 1A [Chelonus insularis]